MSMNEETERLLPEQQDTNVVLRDSAGTLLRRIRPEWRQKDLIKRVSILLPVDPSSACQRIFNASVHDLRSKILKAGLDIADEAASRFKLPSLKRPEDILDAYSVTHVIDLSYRMGLLSRPDWRRLTRCYDIRRDLEHEDDEYVASPEDVVYIFKTCVEVVLSQDALELIRVADVAQALDSPDKFTPSVDFLESFRCAPHPRQFQIIEMLVGFALNSKKPDIGRQNAVELLRCFRATIHNTVKIEVAQALTEQFNKKPLPLVVAKVANAADLLPYLKQRQLAEFFAGFQKRFEEVGSRWTQHAAHPQLLDDFEDVGAFRNCPDGIALEIALWMAQCYLGEPGGYGMMGSNRKVFYSNSAAPKIERLFTSQKEKIGEYVDHLRKNKSVRSVCENKFIARRFQELLDLLV